MDKKNAPAAVAPETVASEGGASKRGASVDWASLRADGPLHKIGDCLLANEEYMDTYSALRQVCRNWRSGLPEPDVHLHEWIMVEHVLPRAADFTFLHLRTSRYVTIDLTEVHARYYFVGFYRGVIVLAQKNQPHKIRLLNPLTKTLNTRFEAHMPYVILKSVAVMKSPTMVFVSKDYPAEIAWVDESTPTKGIDEDWGEGRFSTEHHSLRCITPFNGELYAIAVNNFEFGKLVCTNNVQLEQRASSVNMDTLFSFPELGNNKFYLVKSDGALLLVLLDNKHLEEGQPLVYRVDTESRSLHAVNNIGSRAFFVHYIRCISVDTRVHPTLRPGCIYYADLGYIREYFDDIKAWDEWPIRVDRLGNYGLNFSSRNLLDSAAGGTFMSITLGAATKLLDDMMINYSEWHTERTPQGKKVNSVEETSSLSDKIDVIMSMLVNGRSNVDPNNVPLASLVAQEEHVDVNFIKNSNFNNNAYRNNFGNNYRPYPSNNGNGYGNSYNNSRSVPSGLEVMLKEFISTQTAFNKSVEEKLGKIDVLASKVDSLAADVDLLKLKVMPNEDKDIKSFATANAIQVRINDNIRLMAELHARWEREEKLAKENNVAKVWTITTTSNVDASHVAKPPTINGKIIGVGNVSTPSTKRAKLPETAETVCDKSAEIFQNIGDNDPIALDHNGLDFDNCHISEVIKFLQKLARSPNASAINLAFTKHITNALIKAREEKLKLETSIPRKLEDGWEPIIKMKVNDFDCNALCDLGASISVMPKKLYDMLDLPPLKYCYLDVNLADNSIKKPLGRIDNVHITVNNNLVPVDFVVLDIECNASCPIILGRPFLRTVGAIIDMKEGNIKYQFPLKKGMEHFSRKIMKLPFDFIIRTNYDVHASSLDVT
ncbi:hypothetical protein QYE76_063397 [Lolium multiflorum]|uniref:KIB1-4 beta-propeller domain-containing protein n=1 Tax=Lolium multiflorum TaxID=4521 RepID=A0AAD8S4X6_LOLMU|nr:hypothetical protein QYE76_063397 [Lolium multiflorum]